MVPIARNIHLPTKLYKVTYPQMHSAVHNTHTISVQVRKNIIISIKANCFTFLICSIMLWFIHEMVEKDK